MLTRQGRAGFLKLRKKSKKPKIQSNFDNQAECDGVKDQSTSAIRYAGVKKVGKQPKGKTRSMRKIKTKSLIRISPTESPISVVGKSPCGQVDCLKELYS
jgi:hypothetical protein